MKTSLRASLLGPGVPAKNYWPLPAADLRRLLWQLLRLGIWLGLRPIAICCILLSYFGLPQIYGMVFQEGVPTGFEKFVAPALAAAIICGVASSSVVQFGARAIGLSAQTAFNFTAVFAVAVAMFVLGLGFGGHWNSIILLSAFEAFLATGFSALASVSLINWYHGAELDDRANALFASFDAVLAVTLQPIQARLPASKQGPVLAMSVEKKHLAVVTENGVHRLRLTMREALTELGDDVGVLVHRSHWVRVDQIQERIMVDGKPALLLLNGTVVPVSRRRLAELKASYGI